MAETKSVRDAGLIGTSLHPAMAFRELEHGGSFQGKCLPAFVLVYHPEVCCLEVSSGTHIRDGKIVKGVPAA
jgi:hypothetical protein